MKEKRATLEGLSIVTAFEAAKLQRRLGVRDDDPYAFVDGRFRLIERLGTGAFGKVFLAEDRELAREVAVKVMVRGDPELADREGKALAAFMHANIVKIFDHGQEADYRWLVLELLRGPTLHEWCVGKTTGQILARYREAGKGLDAAHGRGLAHQDFKPSNVRLNEDGHAVVVDFGFARNLESLEGAESRSRARPALGGTLLYMSRERILGRPGDERSDQFAFCVALWEALAHERPFGDEEDPAIRVGLLTEEPRGHHRVPKRLRPVLARGMSPRPEDRWPSMSELLGALEAIEALEQDSSSSGWAWALAAICVCGLGLGLGLAVAGVSGVTKEHDMVTSVELPRVQSASVDAVRALETHDHKGAVVALWSGCPAAIDEGEESEFLPVAMMVAQHLDGDGEATEIADAWWVVTRLNGEIGDEDQTITAADKVKGQLDQIMKLTRGAPSPRSR